MSLFDSIAGALEGAGGAHSGLAGEMLDLIGGAQGGGLASLVRAFEGHGLGSLIESWISSGANLPISAKQIASVFGQGQINQIAAKFDLAPDAVAAQIARLLPQLVDRLTPHGSIPDSDVLQEGLSLLRSKLGLSR
jgi:uncharacterized protein YidB (DUF937 family)